MRDSQSASSFNAQTEQRPNNKNAPLAEGLRLELWMSEQASDEVALGDSLNDPVHSWVVTCKGRELIWSPPGNHQIGLRVELISPEPCGPERLIGQLLAEMVVEASREDKDARGAPSERNDSRSLMRWVVYSRNQNVASEHKRLCLPLDFVELGRGVVRATKSSFDVAQLGPE